ncbi:hypothetical protein GBA52_003259 [Prunus armeniaca]|nr:hypothetical protein GBA52_003259 [Prunus armeniaca]
MGSKGSLFGYADDIDRLLLFFGTLGSIGDGSVTPLTMVVLGGMINEYRRSIPSNETLNEPGSCIFAFLATYNCSSSILYIVYCSSTGIWKGTEGLQEVNRMASMGLLVELLNKQFHQYGLFIHMLGRIKH